MPEHSALRRILRAIVASYLGAEAVFEDFIHHSIAPAAEWFRNGCLAGPTSSFRAGAGGCTRQGRAQHPADGLPGNRINQRARSNGNYFSWGRWF